MRQVLFFMLTFAFTTSLLAQEGLKRQDEPEKKEDKQEEKKDKPKKFKLPQEGPKRPGKKLDPGTVEARRLAKKCGRAVHWRSSQEQSLEDLFKESKKSGRLVLIYIYERSRSQKFGNWFKDGFVMAGPLMDPDLVTMINRKFIPIRMNLTGLRADELGISLASVIVPGFLFYDPVKKTIAYQYHKIATPSSEHMYYRFRKVLLDHPEYDKPSEKYTRALKRQKSKPDHLRSRYKLGLETMRDGGLEESVKIFRAVLAKGPETREAVESLYRLARCLRWLPDAKGAREALSKAQELNDLET